MEVARLSDVLRRPGGGVGALQVEYARRVIEERVGSVTGGQAAAWVVGIRICGR